MLAAFASLFIAAPAAAQEAAYVQPPGSLGAPTNAELPPPDSADRSQLAPRPRKKTKGWVIDVDHDVAIPISTTQTKTAGYSLDLRVGYRFPIAGPMWISPEGDFGWVQFPRWDGAIRYGGGARVGFDLGVVEPAAYLYGGGFQSAFVSGWGLRAGAALDVRVLSFLRPGVHVEYDAAGWKDLGHLEYVGTGIHMGFVF
jgi:hypothetical protein